MYKVNARIEEAVRKRPDFPVIVIIHALTGTALILYELFYGVSGKVAACL